MYNHQYVSPYMYYRPHYHYNCQVPNVFHRNHAAYHSSQILRVQQFPPVNPNMFNQSAASMQTLMKDASKVLNKIASSNSFSTKVLTAAQESDLQEVDRLIKSTGVKSKVESDFTPDGINLKLHSNIGNTECCHLSISLRWR